MKKILLAAVLAAASFGAQAQIGYPGSTWGELTFDPSVVKGTPEDDNIQFQGAIQQGIDWTKIGRFTFNTYVGMNYSIDRNHLSYNNKIVPMIGMKLLTPVGNEGVAEVGVRLVHQRNFRGVTEGPNSGTGVQAYGQYWFGWNLKK